MLFSEEMMEALIGIVELLSTHSVCFPALKNEKLIKQLSTIIIQEDEISLIATCAIALANIESEHEGGILTGGKFFIFPGVLSPKSRQGISFCSHLSLAVQQGRE